MSPPPTFDEMVRSIEARVEWRSGEGHIHGPIVWDYRGLWETATPEGFQAEGATGHAYFGGCCTDDEPMRRWAPLAEIMKAYAEAYNDIR